MKFHLNHTPAKPGFEIDHRQGIFLIGSCFSENIGNLLQQHKFNVYANPSGILFNPISMYNTLNMAVHPAELNEKLILERDTAFLSYWHHSSVQAADKTTLLQRIHSDTLAAHGFIKKADVLIITFGTAFFYGHLALHTVVANCHKQPAATFEKQLADMNDIVALYSQLIKEMETINPKLKIIFTVSPVKHLKDGLVENSISKSTLILSVHELIKKFSNCYYFPAYELVNDDLRDYRFYKEDLAHPNEQAIAYVWQKFSDCYFSPGTTDLNQRIAKLNAALHHRGMHDKTEEGLKLKEFIAKQKEEIRKIEPGIEI